MNLESIYYVSQIMSTAAVVGSLIYLGRQSHQSARNQVAQMHQARSELLHDYTLRLTEEGFSPLARAAFHADPALDDQQIHRFYYYAVTVLRFGEELYREWRDGMIADDRWNTTRRTLEGMLRAPGYRASYSVLRGALDPGFVTVVDEIVQRTRDQPIIDPVAEWRAAAARERLPRPATT